LNDGTNANDTDAAIPEDLYRSGIVHIIIVLARYELAPKRRKMTRVDHHKQAQQHVEEIGLKWKDLNEEGKGRNETINNHSAGDPSKFSSSICYCDGRLDNKNETQILEKMIQTQCYFDQEKRPGELYLVNPTTKKTTAPVAVVWQRTTNLHAHEQKQSRDDGHFPHFYYDMTYLWAFRWDRLIPSRLLQFGCVEEKWMLASNTCSWSKPRVTTSA
jgi:hypothetical protein